MNKKLQPQKTQNLRSQRPQKPSVPQWSQETHPHYPHSSLTKKMIGAGIKVHKNLGPGFTEKIYQRALYLELKSQQITFEREKKINIYYNKANLCYEKVDFEIEKKVIVELKAVSEIQDIHRAQLISYLKASKQKVGLILNFAKETLEIKRLIV